MKIIIKGVAAVMLLLGSASAYQQKDQVANELSALSHMIDEMEQPNAESFSAESWREKIRSPPWLIPDLSSPRDTPMSSTPLPT